MSEPTPLPAAQREQARLALKAREDGIRAAAIKAGRAAEREDWHKALGVASMAEATEVAHLRAELKARPSHTELAHARSSAWWRGAAITLLVGIAAGAAITNFVLGAAFQQAGQYGREMVVTGAISQATNPPTRCVPGEHLQDGRVCPQASN